jgi:hypothetical protein
MIYFPPNGKGKETRIRFADDNFYVLEGGRRRVRRDRASFIAEFFSAETDSIRVQEPLRGERGGHV